MIISNLKFFIAGVFRSKLWSSQNFTEVFHWGGGYSGVRTENTQSGKICLNFNFGGGGYFGVNFGHLKSEVFHGGVFQSKLWSSQI